MSKPTLLQLGKLVSPTDNAREQLELNSVLPIDYIMNWFKARLQLTGIKNRLLVLQAETASGKSTVMPPEIYKTFIMNGPPNGPGIICTQPRVLTAIENVNEMLKFNKMFTKGHNIGWLTKSNKIKVQTSASLISATVGVLSTQLDIMDDRDIMKKYKFIIIDETHQRDHQTDFTIIRMKHFMTRNADNIDCPFLILTSATIDPDMFIDFFNRPIDMGVIRANNFIWCRGQTAGIEIKWAGENINNFVSGAVDTVKNIIKTKDDINKADILIFLTGMDDFSKVYKELKDLNKQNAILYPDRIFSLLQIDSGVVKRQDEDYKKITFIPTARHEVYINDTMYKPARRIILSTNVAETGLTLENLKYVIDTGFNKESEFQPLCDLSTVIAKPAPQSRVTQRKGRAGRKFPGVFYPLYTEKTFNALQKQQFSQILISDLSPSFIDLLEMQPEGYKIAKMDMIEDPPMDMILYNLRKFYKLGAITLNPVKLSKMGEYCAQLKSFDIHIVRMILGAYFWKIPVNDMITIGAYLMLDSLKKDAMEPLNWGEIYKRFTTVPYHIIQLTIMDEFINGIALYQSLSTIKYTNLYDYHEKINALCDAANLSYNSIISFITFRDEIINAMIEQGFEVGRFRGLHIDESLMNYITSIKYCIYDGFRTRLVTLNNDEYAAMMGAVIVNRPAFFTEPKEIAEKAKDLKPRLCVYHLIDLKFDRKKKLYKPRVKIYSMMDGFIKF